MDFVLKMIQFLFIIIILQLSYFINMDMLHLYKNGSIISMEFATYGTLLSVISTYKTASVS